MQIYVCCSEKCVILFQPGHDYTPAQRNTLFIHRHRRHSPQPQRRHNTLITRNDLILNSRRIVVVYSHAKLYNKKKLSHILLAQLI